MVDFDKQILFIPNAILHVVLAVTRNMGNLVNISELLSYSS